MLTNPTAHLIDAKTGVMSGPSGRYEKRLGDLGGIYADQSAFDALLSSKADEVVYTVHEVRPVAQNGDLIFGTTHMLPGRVGDEFYLTRGHIHARANRPETYCGESGEGLLLLESPEGETRFLEMAPRAIVYVPPLWIHRSVNTGATPLVMSFCYPSDSGQDYEIIARSGGMAKRIVADGTGWKAIANTSYRPRTAAEVAAVMSTCD